MSAKLELKGKRFGRLTVLKEHGKDKSGKSVWECVCDCGKHTFPIGSNLVSGKIMSCGCLRNEKSAKRFLKHGMRNTRLYKKWQGMIRRCTEKSNKSYKHYGERGISVCEEWSGQHGFENFAKWAFDTGYDENAPIGKYTIERKDVNGNYCPENCCWIPLPDQSRNKTTTIRFGKDKIVVDVARENHIPPSTVYGRLRRGVDMNESVLITKSRKKKVKKISIETGYVLDTYESVREAARSLGKSPSDISLCANGKLKHAYGFIWRY